VKLLLDEHYSRRIAEELRAAGHDVYSVQERQDLRGLEDRALLTQASAEGRALMTENVGDFMPLVREAAAAGDRHMGVILTSPRSLPRGIGTIGVYVERLDEFLRERPAEDALTDQVHWL
jgi:predicted nuclease of predicted toxin-antitoxin system